MGYIFISYSHKDKTYAHKLHRSLIEQGFDAWIDDRIDYGSRWPREIEARLQGCVAFVLIMSPDSYESDWVQNELSLARQLNKPIFPVLLDGNVWWHLQTTQYVDVKGGKLPPTKFFVRLAELAPRDLDYHPSTKDEPKEPAPSGVSIGKNVSGSVIVSGSGNVINVNNQETPASSLPRKEAKPQEPVVKPAPLVEKKMEKQKGPVPKFDFRLLAIGGIVLLVLILGGMGLNYLIQHLPTATATMTSPENTATFELPTLTDVLFTSTPQPTETPLPAPTLGIGSSMTGQDGMILLYVPAGKFTMGAKAEDALAECQKYQSGCQLSWFKNEEPPHEVDLTAFWLDQTDVTNAMYTKCVSAGKCDPPSDTSHYNNSSYANHPVVYVNWNKAKTYCEWAGRQLPTEAQWEKAARGTDGRIYPWGNTAPDNTLLNYNSNVGDTTEVGKYPKGASPYGTLDMAGNVWQWVADWYNDTYYQSSPSSNPLGPDSGQSRVLRGGTWFINDDGVRSADRGWNGPTNTVAYFIIGFRCSRSP